MARRDPPDVRQLYSVRVDDAELVRLAASGDRDAWGTIYDRYADHLHDYCWGILRDRHEAEDALHDAFVTAATKLHQLRDPSSLRPWLYSICRTQALARTRRRARELPTDELPEMTAPTDADDTDVDYLRQLVWDAAGGLAPRDRAVLDLHLRQGLQGQELAAALGVKEHHATVLLGRVREHVDRSLGALLVARTGRRDCRELDELLSGWDGSLSPLLRKRVARHIDNCDVCSERRRRMVSPAALLAGVPILPAPGYLRDRVLDDVALASSGSADGQYLTTRVQHWAPLVAAAVVAALIVAGAAFFALRPTTAPVSATGVGPSLTPAVPSASATPGTVVTVPPQEPTATATAAIPVAAPGVIELLTDAVDFGDTSTEASLQFRNTGDSEVSWTLSPQDGAIAASAASGSLASGETVDVALTLDRDALTEGEFSSTIDIFGAGSFSVPVSASVERAPVISGLRASRGFIVFGSAAGRCATVQVAAAVADDLDVTVSLFWQSSGGTNEIKMDDTGGSHSGVVGPVATPGGDIRWWVIATDERGNSARSSVQTLPLQPPPCT
jgi:RNA polymerase sigma factor (sigma-70 family)